MELEEPPGWRFFADTEEPVDADDPELDRGGARHTVTCVVVAHGRGPWLPALRDALASSDWYPDRLIAVDTSGPEDAAANATVLAELPAAGRVLSAPSDAGFGRAVAYGIERQGFAAVQPPARPGRHSRVLPPIGVDGTAELPAVTGDLPAVATTSDQSGARPPAPPCSEWLWLLHDDCAPAPDALRRLLQHASRRPEVGIWGPKLREWPDGTVLTEAGVSISLGGRRETHVGPGEHDQGQHDTERRLLAVSTAGMLVRRDVWEELGGLRPELTVFRDDVDLGWRANLAGYDVRLGHLAVVRHAEAAATGQRRLAHHRPYALDRRHGYWTVLANAPGVLLPVLMVRMLLGAVLRAGWFVLGKSPSGAVAEVGAVLAALASVSWLGARRRAPTAVRPYREIKHLVAGSAEALRHTLGDVADSVSARFGDAASVTGAAAPGSGEVEVTRSLGEDRTSATRRAGRRVRRLFGGRRPMVIWWPVLVVATLVAGRALIGGGVLQSPFTLPAPDGAVGLWRSWTHAPAGLPPAWWPGLAALPSLLLGGPSAFVSVLTVGAAPLAALTAWLFLRRLVASPGVRAVGACGYGVAVLGTGAVGHLRLGSLVAAIVLPLLVAAWHAVAGRRRLARSGNWRAAWLAGMCTAVMLAFTPGLGALLVLGQLAAALVLAVRAAAAAARQLALAAVVGVLLCGPWLLGAVRHPEVFGREAGGAVTAAVSPFAGVPTWHGVLRLVTATLPDGLPWWLSIWLPVATVVAAVVARRSRLVVIGCAAALLGMAATALSSRIGVGAGPYALVTAGGLILAVTGGLVRLHADRVRRAGAATAVVAVLVAAGAAWWVVTGLAGPVHRGPAVPLPAYMTTQVTADNAGGRTSVLVLRGGVDDVRYTVASADGSRWPAADRVGTPAAGDAVARRSASSVAGLIGADPDAAQQLWSAGVDYVYLPAPVDSGLAASLDRVAGLRRAGAGSDSVAWHVIGTGPRGVAPEVLSATGGPARTGWRWWLTASWLIALVFCLPSVRPSVQGTRRRTGR